MKEKIQLNYVNDRLQIGLVDVKQVYELSPAFRPLMPEVYRGLLVYRAKGSSKRTSYAQIKKGLVKRKLVIEREVPDWLWG